MKKTVLLFTMFFASMLTLQAQRLMEQSLDVMPKNEAITKNVASNTDVQWGEWYDYKTGTLASSSTYIYSQMFGEMPTEVTIQRRDSGDGTQSQLLISKLFGDFDALFDYNPTDGTVTFYDIDTRLKFPGYEDYDDVLIQMNSQTFYPKRETNFNFWFILIRANQSGFNCPITFTPNDKPDGALDAEFTVDGVNATKATLKINQLGADVATVKYAVLPRTALYMSDLSLLDSEDSELDVITLSVADATGYSAEIPLTSSGPWYVMMQVYDHENDVLNYTAKRVYTALDEPEKWKTLGKGEFTDGELTYLISMASDTHTPLPEWYGQKNTWEVEVQESVETPGLYRVVNPYTCEACPYDEAVMRHIIDGEVWNSQKYAFYRTSGHNFYLIIHAENTENGIVWAVPTLAGYTFQQNDEIDAAPSLKDYQLFSNISGVSTTNYNSLNPSEATLINDGGIFTATNSNSSFKLILPGAEDYSFTLSIDNNNCVVSNLGKDVKKIVYAVAEASEMDATQLKEAVANGTVECASVVPTEDATTLDLSMFNIVPFKKYVVYVATVDETGKLRKDNTIEYLENYSLELEYVGLGTMEEPFMQFFTGYEPGTIDVQIYNTPQNPNLIFVKDPVARYGYASTDYKYLVVNIESPTRVSIVNNLYGLFNGSETYYFTTISEYYRANGYSDAQIEAAGMFGTYNDNIVTIPGTACLLNNAGNYYYAKGETLTITLPEGAYAGIPEIIDRNIEEGTPEYYDLNGNKVVNLHKGIYIKKQGSKVTKIVVK